MVVGVFDYRLKGKYLLEMFQVSIEKCVWMLKRFLGSDVNPDPTTSKLLKNGRIIKLVGKKKDCTATDPVGKKLRIINFQQTNKVFHLKIFSTKPFIFLHVFPQFV